MFPAMLIFPQVLLLRSLHFLQGHLVQVQLQSKQKKIIINNALINYLTLFLQMPSTAGEWLEVEKGFSGNFPHAIGAIDGKHITILCPAHTGSEYYNYKRTFSIVLLALVDSNYQFIFADIGTQGRISDGGVFRNSILWQDICSNNLNLPTPCPLPGSTVDVPYVFLGDGAFALSTHVMKPYPGNHEPGSPQRIFNEKLGRSRVLVENTFGILAAKFRVFKKPIALNAQKATLITMACILLHNFLKNSETSQNLYIPPGTVDTSDDNDVLIQPGSWRQNVQNSGAFQPLQQTPRRPTMNATQIRETFTSYFYNNL